MVADRHVRGGLVVQPRMGFADLAQMRQGLLATRDAMAATVGTITLDSYTRVGDHGAVRQALAADTVLNGYPIVDRGPAATTAMLDGVLTPQFPVQVRHGSADPRRIVATLLDCGLHATEGGPVSYCLPYSQMPLSVAVDNWRQCCETLAAVRGPDCEPHLETFGGCRMGRCRGEGSHAEDLAAGHLPRLAPVPGIRSRTIHRDGSLARIEAANDSSWTGLVSAQPMAAPGQTCSCRRAPTSAGTLPVACIMHRRRARHASTRRRCWPAFSSEPLKPGELVPSRLV